MTEIAPSLAARAARACVLVLLLALAAVLGVALASMTPAEGLGGEVLRQLERSGVESPVTAVLLNFRGYDTMLELAVLFIALLGVWSIGPMPQPVARPSVPVLRILNGVLVPFLVLFAAYLLWAGAHAPGGAFQAGAVVAAAGVLVAMTGRPSPAAVPTWLPRMLIGLGLIAFIGIALATAVAGGLLLEYPLVHAKWLILLIEAAATCAIGLTLTAMFLGGLPPSQSIGR